MHRGGYINVFVLDDHDIVRQGIRDLLTPARDVNVVGDSGHASGAADSILRRKTHVMVLDLQMQDGNGVRVCRQVRSVDPSIKGLLLTSSDDDAALAAAVLSGADACLVKLTRASDILQAVRDLGAGRTLIEESVAARVAGQLRARARALVPALSETENGLLDLVLAGFTDQQIAHQLGRDLTSTQNDVAALTDRMMTTPRTSSAVAGDTGLGGVHRRST
jgi:DNA-binding NarL/FixJ family response regulator